DVIEGTADCTQADRVTTTYSDSLGRPVLVIDPDGNRTRTDYDPLGRAFREITPLGVPTSTYDLADPRTALVGRAGRQRHVHYPPHHAPPSPPREHDQEQIPTHRQMGTAAQTWYHDLVGRTSRIEQGGSLGLAQTLAFPYTPLDQPATITRTTGVDGSSPAVT